jgi:plasmid stabilization system protein ParE
MSLRIVFTSLARADIADTTYYLAERSAGAAVKFFDCVRYSTQLLSKMPELGAVARLEDQRTKGIRIWPVKDFSNHLIFYQIETEELIVLRVLHGSTDYETLFQSS